MTENMDNEESDNGFVVCAEVTNTLAERTALGDSEAPEFHQTRCGLCNSALKNIQVCPERNAVVISALQKYEDTLAAAEAAMEAELKEAVLGLDLCKDDCKCKANELADCQVRLDTAIVEAIEKIPKNSNNYSFRYESCVKSYIDKLSTAKTALVDAKQMQKIFEDKLDIAEARHNAAKDRCNKNKLLAEIRSEIKTSVDIGGLNAKHD